MYQYCNFNMMSVTHIQNTHTSTVHEYMGKFSYLTTVSNEQG